MQDKINLAGEWEFGFGTEKPEDVIVLPSTTEISKKGAFMPDREQTLHLSRKYPYTGKALYRREINIPESWEGFHGVLVLERTKYTEVYLDGRKVSESHETLIPQRHDLGTLSAGSHSLCVVVDNDLEAKEDFPNSLMRGHQYTDHTQTNWNGILGEIYLEKSEGFLAEKPLVTGDCDRGGFAIRVRDAKRVTVACRAGDGTVLPEICLEKAESQGAGGEAEYFYPVAQTECWDEFHPAYYDLRISVTDRQGRTREFCERAGIRSLKREDRRLLINGVPVFLRGTVDCCIYPKTGACPMDRDSWLEIFRKLQSYGLNHCRFHSWCPPHQAFAAADELGMYLQAELSNFANGLYREENPACDKVLHAYIWQQSEKILREYGNHPSFLIFAAGNEMIGDLEEYERLIRHLRALRPDKLYTQGANNFLEQPVCSSADDCWIMMRTRPGEEAGNARASFSHGDLPLGYLQTEEPPSTLHDYKEALEYSPLPLISHEIGQYQCYPDYRELEKYTGPLSPENLKIFQRRLEEAGMGQLSQSFFQASGRLAVQCYREEIEAALRTEGMSGFQLLGLQDFPGQGTALVGILDSFLDSKGLIAPEEFRQFCQSRVLLAKFSGYVWQAGEEFTAQLLCANYGREALEGILSAELWTQPRDGAGRKVKNSRREIPFLAKAGQLCSIGEIQIKLPAVSKPQLLKLRLRAGELTNEYPLWIYPGYGALDISENEVGFWKQDVWVTNTFSEKTAELLKQGKKVALFSDRTREEWSVRGFFAPDFWCWPMFREACEEKGLPAAPGTLGMVCDKEHPALADFPTENYAQWQWQPLLYHSRPVILDGWGKEITPLVQVIDNFERNHRLALVFETGIAGGGYLLMCACDVFRHLEKPQVRQLYESLVQYAASEAFCPKAEVKPESCRIFCEKNLIKT